MNRVVLALGSFLVGACFSFVASSFIHASTRAQRQGVVLGGAEPVVPPIGFNGVESTIAGDLQSLDGIACNRCVIAASVITYAGGLVNLTDCRVVSKAPITLKGAAENTLKFLMAIGAVTPPKAAPKTNPKTQMAGLELNPQNNFSLVLTESK